MIVLLGLHILAAVAWVGGMGFAHGALRPAAAMLDPPVRLALWRGVLERFFRIVWVSIAVLLLSGFAMVFVGFGGFAGVGLHIEIMMGTGIVMALLFAYLHAAPWRRFRDALDRSALAEAAQSLLRIRRIVEINLALGLVTIVAGATGRYW